MIARYIVSFCAIFIAAQTCFCGAETIPKPIGSSQSSLPQESNQQEQTGSEPSEPSAIKTEAVTVYIGQEVKHKSAIGYGKATAYCDVAFYPGNGTCGCATGYLSSYSYDTLTFDSFSCECINPSSSFDPLVFADVFCYRATWKTVLVIKP